MSTASTFPHLFTFTSPCSKGSLVRSTFPSKFGLLLISMFVMLLKKGNSLSVVSPGTLSMVSLPLKLRTRSRLFPLYRLIVPSGSCCKPGIWLAILLSSGTFTKSFVFILAPSTCNVPPSYTSPRLNCTVLLVGKARVIPLPSLAMKERR